MLTSSDLAGVSITSAASTTFTTLATYSYTPVSASSYIIIEYYTSYAIGGYGTDTFASQIAIGGAAVSSGLQQFLVVVQEEERVQVYYFH